jgi:arginase
MLGIRDIDAGERTLIEREGIWMRTADEWRAGGIEATLDAAFAHLARAGVDAIHVSFDVDVLDPSVMPGTGTAVPDGLSLDDAWTVIRRLRSWDAPIRSFDVVELNPALDPSGGSAEVATALVRELLGAT